MCPDAPCCYDSHLFETLKSKKLPSLNNHLSDDQGWVPIYSNHLPTLQTKRTCEKKRWVRVSSRFCWQSTHVYSSRCLFFLLRGFLVLSLSRKRSQKKNLFFSPTLDYCHIHLKTGETGKEPLRAIYAFFTENKELCQIYVHKSRVSGSETNCMTRDLKTCSRSANSLYVHCQLHDHCWQLSQSRLQLLQEKVKRKLLSQLYRAVSWWPSSDYHRSY